jgi:ankyrin repeat protein
MHNNLKYINEKFTEDSDPIADMNIGMIHQIKLWMKSINEPFENKHNALVCSAGYGKLDFVEYLLAAGADVHADDDYALQLASDNRRTEVVKVLLAAGADVHADDDFALQLASSNGHTEVVKVLLAAGADVHAEDDWALQLACSNRRTNVVKVLKDHIAKEKKVKESLNEKFTSDSDPIHDMGIGIENAINKWLKTLPTRQQYYLDESKLAIAAQYGKTDFVKYLIDKGTNIHVWEEWALRWAAINGYVEIVKFLIDAGADLQSAVAWKFAYAVKNDYFENLINAGADPKELLKIAQKQNLKKAQYILKKYINKMENKSNLKEMMSGVSAPISTPMNTPGMGNVSPAGIGRTGSGDKFGNTIGGKPYTQGGKVKTKRKKKVMNKKKIVKEDVNETFIDTATLITSIASLLVFTSILRISLKNAVKDRKIRNIVKRLAQQPKIREIVKTNNIYSKNKLRDIFAKYLTEDELQYLHEIDDIDVEIEADKIEEAAPRDFSKKNFGSKKHRHYFRHIDVDAKCIKCGKTREQIKQKVNENNLNPYDKLGMAMAKKLGIKPPFKKKKGSKNQNAMVQKKFEHQILTFDEFRNQLNENK